MIEFEIVLDHFENHLKLIFVFLFDQEELIEHKNQLNKDEIFSFFKMKIDT